MLLVENSICKRIISTTLQEKLTFQSAAADVGPSEVEREDSWCGLKFWNEGRSGERCSLNIGGVKQVNGTHAHEDSIACHLNRTVDDICAIVNGTVVGQVCTVRVVSTSAIVGDN